MFLSNDDADYDDDGDDYDDDDDFDDGTCMSIVY